MAFCWALAALGAEREVTVQRAVQLAAELSPDDLWEKTRDASTLAWNESHTLHALVDLYEVTGDRKYLDDVVFRGDRMLSHRDDRRGVPDASGVARPGWTMGFKYVVASGELVDAEKKPILKVRSTPFAFNHLTKLQVISGANGRFRLLVSNEHFKSEEAFDDLSLDTADVRFVEKIVNHPRSPMTPVTQPGEAVSQLIRVTVVKNVASGAMLSDQTITLQPIPLAYMGYIGIIYHPLLRLCEIVRADAKLADLGPAAQRFIDAAEESYADAAKRLWRDGPNAGEGYYLYCEKGESYPHDNIGQPFNYLGRHTAAELALFRLNGNAEHRERAEKMAGLLKHRLEHDAANDLYRWNYWYEPATKGWTSDDDLSFNTPWFAPYTSPEDTSHGVLDIEGVAAAHAEKLVFDDADLKRFANTFLKNVMLPDRSGVHRKVDGKGDPYHAYDAASRGWLVLSRANPEVLQADFELYRRQEKDDFRWLAALLKWQKVLSPLPPGEN
ncbi:MAG: hypothetical protein H0T11_02560 [Chthoniobacterales bacterium]|nr:hypothetical protein [Chthoniobacterales bacterium]